MNMQICEYDIVLVEFTIWWSYEKAIQSSTQANANLVICIEDRIVNKYDCWVLWRCIGGRWESCLELWEKFPIAD